MIVIRHCFVAKPGHGSKLAKLIKEAIPVTKLVNARVLTDLTGDFNRVILEHEAETLAGFEASQQEYMTNKAFQEKMKGYTDLWISGSREILQIA